MVFSCYSIQDSESFEILIDIGTSEERDIYSMNDFLRFNRKFMWKRILTEWKPSAFNSCTTSRPLTWAARSWIFNLKKQNIKAKFYCHS